MLKPGKVVKPPVASRAAVNKKLGLTQSRQARNCNGERELEVLSGREEVEQVEVESRKESEDKVSAEATNILGNRSSGGEVPTNVRDGRKVCISGGDDGTGDLGKAEAIQGGLEGNEELVDQSDQHIDVQSETRHGERRREGGLGSDGRRGEVGLSTLERVSKVSKGNRTTVTYWSEQFL